MRAVGCPAFGASRHVANIVLTAMRFDPAMRAAMNIRYRQEWISLLESSPLDVASFSRAGPDGAPGAIFSDRTVTRSADVNISITGAITYP